MIIKKNLMFLFCIIFLLSLVLAQDYKMDVSTTKETFGAGENITFIITLYDSQNNPIDGAVLIIIEDANKKTKIERNVRSKELTSIDLGEKISSGQWSITAKYADIEAIGLFFIKTNEQIEVELIEDVLTLKNIGNTRYTKNIEIVIGETSGIKEPILDVGEKVSYRLIAPEGVYDIKIVVDGGIIFSKRGVSLTGRGLTGDVIGALDEETSKRSPLTGGISPDEEADDAILSYLRSSKFVYIFMVVIFGAMILLTIERTYRKRLEK